jgi:hypothetical protein
MEKARDSRGLFQIISTQRPEWFEANIQKTKSGLRVCRVGAATTSLPDTQRCLRHTAHGWTKRWMKSQARMAANRTCWPRHILPETFRTNVKGVTTGIAMQRAESISFDSQVSGL